MRRLAVPAVAISSSPPVATTTMTVVVKPRKRVERRSEENTGEVNVLNAMEPEEAEVVQGIVDDLINSDADYEATLEASGTSRRTSDPFGGR